MLNFVQGYTTCIEFYNITFNTQTIKNQTIMKHTANFQDAVYSAPQVDVCSVKVESGFEASMPGVTINPWESEGDSLEF